jgi:preprotein translocase subunit YajC
MENLIPMFLLLAEDAPADPAAGGPSPFSGLIWILPVMLLFWFLLIMPQKRRERAERESLMTNLKPNARVVTHSGIIGVVTAVNRESDSVTIRVDDNNNTKIRVLLGAVARILTDEPKDAPSK